MPPRAAADPSVRRGGRANAQLADNPAAYIAGDRRRALGTGTPMPDRVNGSALFADISGFTALTEALVATFGPQRGAEELTRTLDVVFDAVLGELHRFGGSVIYFSGDAVTCWLDGDDGAAAVSCGFAMQRALAKVGTIETPDQVVELGMKVAVAAGPARRFVVGDPDVQLIDVLAGVLMDRVAECEHHAERGEVVVDLTTRAALGDRVEVSEVRGQGDDATAVVSSISEKAGVTPRRPAGYPRLSTEVVRQWLLPAVYQRMRAGRGEFLSELRPAVPMFVRFGGIDYDADEAPRLLDEFIQRVQWAVDGHGGNLLQLTIGDKGSYLYAVFGSPVAHEDDATRACLAALDVLSLADETAANDLQIGIASGRVRSGTYGHRQRRTFCCLGDPVNLSARLMGAAPTGQVYVSEAVQRATDGRFGFEDVGALALKGKAAPVRAARLTGPIAAAAVPRARAIGPLVGRDEELELLVTRARTALAGRGQLVSVTAEAGLGKTRLVEEAVARLEGDATTVTGAASAVGATGAYQAWQPVFATLFGVDPAAVDPDRLAAGLEAADPSLVARLPLLGTVFGIPIDDNELTARFDAKLRKASLENLLVQWLSWRAAQEPFVVVLEDCHWLDQLSVDLLERVTRALPELPVAVVLTFRPGSFSPLDLDHTTVLSLEGLDDASCATLLGTRLASAFGPDVVPAPNVVDLLLARAEGNPFYLEELVNYLHDEGTDPADATAEVELPSSLSTLVLSRIDTLAESPRRTLKVASVVGREFGLEVLTGAYPELGSRRQLTGHLRRLSENDLVMSDEAAADLYWFKHAVIREVAYDSLPFALRTFVHGRIGHWVETSDPNALDLLAHHFWHSDETDKQREYLLRAGEAAQHRFANAQAADYFRRLLTVVTDEERPPVLHQLGAVLEMPGLWTEAEEVYRELMSVAEALGDRLELARARCALAQTLRKLAHFAEATAELDLAEPAFEEAGDLAGLAQAAHVRGQIANQTGEPDVGWEQFDRALALRRQLGDRANIAGELANMAVSAAGRDEFELARTLTEESLALRTELGDRWGMEVSENNLAMVDFLRHDYASAVEHFEVALVMAHEVGDLLGIATSGHNLGNCARQLGEADQARRRYGEALRAITTTGEQWLVAAILEDVAMLYAPTRPDDALRLVGAADALRDAIGATRVPYRAHDLDEALAPAVERLGADAVGVREAGRALDAEAGRALALSLCA